MNWTNSDLEAVERAIASGVKVVEYHDKRIEYQSMKDLKSARRMIMIALGLTAPGSSVRVARFRKGTR